MEGYGITNTKSGNLVEFHYNIFSYLNLELYSQINDRTEKTQIKILRSKFTSSRISLKLDAKSLQSYCKKMEPTSVKQFNDCKVAMTEKGVQRCEGCHANLTLDQLPIEIIEKILEFLSPNDLAEISATCHKFRDAARKHYQLKLQCGFVTIDTFHYHPHADFKEEKDIYKIRFRNLIPNVKVIIRNARVLTDAVNFISGHCCNHLKALILENMIRPCSAENLIWNDFNMIAEQIKGVEFLILDCRIQLENVPWQLFDNLRALSTEQYIASDRVFPKLRTLCLINRSCGLIPNEFASFLRNHTNLKSIYCKNYKVDINRCVLSTEFKLTSVVLSLEFDSDLIRILDDLQACSDRQTIDLVEIHSFHLDDYMLQRLGRINNVKHIHTSLFSSSKWSDNIYSLPYVQRLCIKVIDSTQQDLNTFLKHFPNLENLRLKFYSHSFNKILSSIIAVLPKLKYLHCFDLNRREFLKNTQEWNEIRSSLNVQFDSSSAMLDDIWCPICCKSNFEMIAYMDKLSN